MIVFRICNPKFADDLSGEGARIYGGRWNSPGVAALYTSAYRSLAALEMAVHVSISLPGQEYQLLEIHVPDSGFIDLRKKLPKNWNQYPIDPQIQSLGNTILKDAKNAGIIAPSALIHEEFNVILNPGYHHFSLIKIKHQRSFYFDGRLPVKL